jgi:cytochrome c-type protein NapB
MCCKTGESMMEKPDRKIGKIFISFAVICVIAVLGIVFSAFTQDQKEPDMEVMEADIRSFDQNGDDIFESYDRISKDYLEGISTERTLSEYYSRRQYLGSPPWIPHEAVETHQEKVDCLTCHAKGGWTEALKRNTPITPHPDQENCRQCHIRPATVELFMAHDWQSISPPRLGRSHLPGSPPPIAHDLQMRENCIACHVGPGTVTAIRVEHPSRGNCRQCHVPDFFVEPFKRES